MLLESGEVKLAELVAATEAYEIFMLTLGTTGIGLEVAVDAIDRPGRLESVRPRRTPKVSLTDKGRTFRIVCSMWAVTVNAF